MRPSGAHTHGSSGGLGAVALAVAAFAAVAFVVQLLLAVLWLLVLAAAGFCAVVTWMAVWHNRRPPLPAQAFRPKLELPAAELKVPPVRPARAVLPPVQLHVHYELHLHPTTDAGAAARPEPPDPASQRREVAR